MTQLVVRQVTEADAVELADLINTIIARGGTTAFEKPFTPESLTQAYLIGAHVTSAVVARDPETGEALGFQILGDYGDELPAGYADIGTYVRVDGKQRGVGTALFGATRANAQARGLVAINATIRADNTGGLTYYGKMGFEDYAVDRAVPLADGTPVDRIHKRYLLIPKDGQ